MSTHNDSPHKGGMNHPDSSFEESKRVGYETEDANIRGVVTFIIVLASSLAVFFVVCFGMGKLINEALIKHDGPLNRWSQEAGVKPANMASDPAIEQQQLRDMVAKFPTPRLQTDDGSMDIAQMHAREDLLLNHYTWIDQKAQTVRIPIARAMQILAEKGLPVEDQQGPQEQAMFGDASTAVHAPLTNGFARTGPELQMIQVRQQRLMSEKDDSLETAH
ncbi:MAG TPA: hypothetical protein VHX63_12110 [Acidobacteriaceae bacterium]|jgi:hypothetical protein|nr:hypothetical protein [Acidobacteriaceae bacterium]